jgi:hypothetical protein
VYTDCHAAVRESALKAWNEHWFGPNPLLRPAEIPKIKLKLSISACELVQDEVKICQGEDKSSGSDAETSSDIFQKRTPITLLNFTGKVKKS